MSQDSKSDSTPDDNGVWDKEACALEVARAWENFQKFGNPGETIEDASILNWHSRLLPDLKIALRQQRLQQRFVSDTVDIPCPNCDSSQKVPLKRSRQPIHCPRCKSTFTRQRSSTRPHRQRSSIVSHEEKSGDLISRYKLETEVGRGAFGVVWKALDKDLKREVALKISHDSEKKDRARFLRETHAVATLSHPGIVPVYDSGESDGRLWMVQQFIDGRTLFQFLHEQGGFLPVHKTAKIGVIIARAIAHAHQQKVVHRDIKPQNILIDKNETPFVVDFGLALMIDRSRLSASGETMGTFAYMAPEQLAGTSQSQKSNSDATTDMQREDVYRSACRADIYSIGAVLYELLTGRPPFEAPDTRSLIHQVLSDEPKPPNQKQIGIPEDLNEICLKCLRKNEADRYQTADELADDLQRFVDGEEVLARPLPALLRTWRWCQRNPKRAAAYLRAGLVVVVAVLGASYAAFDRYVQVDEARGVAEAALGTSERRRTETLVWLNVAQKNLASTLRIGQRDKTFEGAESVHSAFLEDIAENYQSQASFESDDPELEVRRAQVWLMLSDVRRGTSIVSAREACGTAEQILNKVMQTQKNVLAEIELANCSGRLAALARQEGDADSAKLLSEQTLADLQKMDKRKVGDEKEYLSFSLAAALLNHGSLLLEAGDVRFAHKHLTDATDQFRNLVSETPDDQATQAGLSDCLILLGQLASNRGDHSQAIESIRSGLLVLSDFAARYGTSDYILMNRAAGHGYVAAALDAAGQTDEALSEWEYSVDAWAELVERSSETSAYYEQFVLREIDCAQAMYDAGRLRRAEPLLNDAQARIADELKYAEEFQLGADQLVWLEIQGLCLDAKARLESARGNADTALELVDISIEAFDAVADRASENPEIIFRTALVRNHRGQIQHSLGNSEAGVRSIEKAELILKKLAKEHSNWPRLHFALEQSAFCSRERGVILSASGHVEEATTALRDAIELWKSLVDDYGLPRFRNNLAWFLIEVPDRSLRDAKHAVALASSLREELPTNPAYAALHGASLSVAGQHQESIAILRKVTAQHPDRRARDWLYLSRSQAELQQADESTESLQKGSDWMDAEMPAESWLTRLRAEVSEIIESQKHE